MVFALAVLLGGVTLQLRCAVLHSDRYDQLLLYASQNDAATPRRALFGEWLRASVV